MGKSLDPWGQTRTCSERLWLLSFSGKTLNQICKDDESPSNPLLLCAENYRNLRRIIIHNYTNVSY